MERNEGIKCASKDYVNYLLDKQEYHNENYTEDDIRQAFEKGAMFADKNPDVSSLWHDASEEPNKSAWIISECDSGYINIDWGSLTSRFWYGWGSFVLFHDVRRWAYIDDFIHKTMI